MNKIFKFGWRPALFMGADRELTLITGSSCVVVSAYSYSIVIIITSVLIWLLAVYFFRLMAKADPLMRLVYIKHIKYRRYYLAKSTPFCNSNRIYR